MQNSEVRMQKTGGEKAIGAGRNWRRSGTEKGLIAPAWRGKITAGSLEAWCSGLTCCPVKAEIAGSNPVASAEIWRRPMGWRQFIFPHHDTTRLAIGLHGLLQCEPHAFAKCGRRPRKRIQGD